MRRIIVSMNMTVDGFIATTDGRLDWQFNHWNADMARLLGEQLAMADTILLGRNTYDAMAAYWPVAGCGYGLSRDDIAYATLMNDYPKIVCSKTLRSTPWRNTSIIKANVDLQISKLKQQDGKDIIVYGSPTLVRYLTKKQLIDEYHLWVYPVALGRGIPLFINQLPLRFLGSRPFNSGAVVLSYGLAH